VEIHEITLPRGPRRPPPRLTRIRATHLRRRAVAGAVALGLVLVLVSLVRGDKRSPFGDQQTARAQADPAKLPWRQPMGVAGPLDARGLPGADAQRGAVAYFYRLNRPIFCAGGRGKYAALTFDDGPTEYSQRFAETLRRLGVQTTFFDVGENVVGMQDAQQIINQQQELGGVANHTWKHDFLTQIGPENVARDLGMTNQALRAATGTTMNLFRPPFGARDAAVDAAVHKAGLLPILWSADSRDSGGADQAGVLTNSVEGLVPGGIILLHETYEKTLNVLPQVAAAAKQKGLRLVSIPQLLALDPPSDAQVKAGGDGCGDSQQQFRDEAAGSAMRLNGQPVATAGGPSTAPAATG